MDSMTSTDVSALLAVLLPGCDDSRDSRRQLALKLRATAAAIEEDAAIFNNNDGGGGSGGGVDANVISDGVGGCGDGDGDGGGGGGVGGLSNDGAASGDKQHHQHVVVGEKRDAPSSPIVGASSQLPSATKKKTNDDDDDAHDDARARGTPKKKPYNTKKPAKAKKEFDFTRYPQRHVALHVMYAGWNYHGFASQGAETSGVSTVEVRL